MATVSNAVNSESGTASTRWKLVWSDEFNISDGGLPSSDKWEYQCVANNWVHDEKHNERQWYMSRCLRNTFIKDGSLYIRARHEAKWAGQPFTSGRLTTKGKGDWLYCRVEVRARLPSPARGSWPAIWLMPSEQCYGSWPKSGEIDIMEQVGFAPEEIHATVHTGAYNHRDGTQRKNSVLLPGAHTSFHVYAVEWEPESIRFFIDGECFFEFHKESNATPDQWPFDKPFHLILNVAVGGNWGGAQGIDLKAFPVDMEIDYVRVYQHESKFTANLPPPIPPDRGRTTRDGRSLLHDNTRVCQDNLTQCPQNGCDQEEREGELASAVTVTIVEDTVTPPLAPILPASAGPP